jgi:hypothetical protein
MDPGTARRAPTANQRKDFILDNADLLNRKTKITIISIVLMEIGPSVVSEAAGREVNIDLDAVADISGEVLTHIYNIVLARRRALSQPAGGRPGASCSDDAE